MKVKTYLGNAIDVAGDKAKYDGEAKKLTSDKNILAWIVKYTVEELKDCTLREIADCIEGNPEIAEIPVYPGKRKTDAITGMSMEDKVPGEGEVFYDIRFYIVTPKEERIKLILNVEIQKNYYPGYDLVTRAIFYCARMLSSQMDTEFTADNYDEIKKVYSIWICLDSPRCEADSIVRYHMMPEPVVGENTVNHRYDLLTVVMIGLNENSSHAGKTPLHGILGTLYSDELTPEEKVDILSNRYGIETTAEMKEDMRQMCNLSDAIEEKGIEKGIEKGKERINNLYRKLKKDGRTNDVLKAIDDADYQKQLLKEYEL
ncbi:MAG: hypothetical protein J6C64_03875 [Lachnospiraceae bacterium]|nr:hypothetical protein [Lachnospiraceae bacterium]